MGEGTFFSNPVEALAGLVGWEAEDIYTTSMCVSPAFNTDKKYDYLLDVKKYCNIKHIQAGIGDDGPHYISRYFDYGLRPLNYGYVGGKSNDVDDMPTIKFVGEASDTVLIDHFIRTEIGLNTLYDDEGKDDDDEVEHEDDSYEIIQILTNIPAPKYYAMYVAQERYDFDVGQEFVFIPSKKTFYTLSIKDNSLIENTATLNPVGDCIKETIKEFDYVYDYDEDADPETTITYTKYTYTTVLYRTSNSKYNYYEKEKAVSSTKGKIKIKNLDKIDDADDNTYKTTETIPHAESISFTFNVPTGLLYFVRYQLDNREYLWLCRKSDSKYKQIFDKTVNLEKIPATYADRLRTMNLPIVNLRHNKTDLVSLDDMYEDYLLFKEDPAAYKAKGGKKKSLDEFKKNDIITCKRYEAVKRMEKRIGLDVHDITDQYSENEHIGQITECFFLFAVNPNHSNEGVSAYLYKLFYECMQLFPPADMRHLYISANGKTSSTTENFGPAESINAIYRIDTGLGRYNHVTISTKAPAFDYAFSYRPSLVTFTEGTIGRLGYCKHKVSNTRYYTQQYENYYYAVLGKLKENEKFTYVKRASNRGYHWLFGRYDLYIEDTTTGKLKQFESVARSRNWKEYVHWFVTTTTELSDNTIVAQRNYTKVRFGDKIIKYHRYRDYPGFVTVEKYDFELYAIQNSFYGSTGSVVYRNNECNTAPFIQFARKGLPDSIANGTNSTYGFVLQRYNRHKKDVSEYYRTWTGIVRRRGRILRRYEASNIREWNKRTDGKHEGIFSQEKELVVSCQVDEKYYVTLHLTDVNCSMRVYRPDGSDIGAASISNDKFFIPLNYYIVNKMGLMERTALYGKCRYLIFHAVQHDHYEWYESESFNLAIGTIIQVVVWIIVIVVTVVVTIFSAGSGTAPTASGGTAVATALSTLIAQAVIKALVVSIVTAAVMFGISQISNTFVKVTLTAAVMIVSAYAFGNLSQAISDASIGELSLIALQISTQAFNIITEDAQAMEAKALTEEARKIQTSYESRMKEINEAAGIANDELFDEQGLVDIYDMGGTSRLYNNSTSTSRDPSGKIFGWDAYYYLAIDHLRNYDALKSDYFENTVSMYTSMITTSYCT